MLALRSILYVLDSVSRMGVTKLYCYWTKTTRLPSLKKPTLAKDL